MRPGGQRPKGSNARGPRPTPAFVACTASAFVAENPGPQCPAPTQGPEEGQRRVCPFGANRQNKTLVDCGVPVRGLTSAPGGQELLSLRALLHQPRTGRAPRPHRGNYPGAGGGGIFRAGENMNLQILA